MNGVWGVVWLNGMSACKHGNDIVGSKEGAEFLDQLSYY
jgi:hypothetical protein